MPEACLIFERALLLLSLSSNLSSQIAYATHVLLDGSRK